MIVAFAYYVNIFLNPNASIGTAIEVDPERGLDESRCLAIAAALESSSAHPIAHAFHARVPAP
ncbi:MAG: hypothetical protein P8X87_01405, partial [Candidatus Bathyarchaeota archaeon]